MSNLIHAFRPDEQIQIEALNVGDSATFGGGAQPLYTVTRIN